MAFGRISKLEELVKVKGDQAREREGIVDYSVKELRAQLVTAGQSFATLKCDIESKIVELSGHSMELEQLFSPCGLRPQGGSLGNLPGVA